MLMALCEDSSALGLWCKGEEAFQCQQRNKSKLTSAWSKGPRIAFDLPIHSSLIVLYIHCPHTTLTSVTCRSLTTERH